MRHTVRSLIGAVDGAALLHGRHDALEITAIEHDSRRVEPGALFVAVPGADADGHRFLGHAVRAGARLVVVQRDREAVWRDLPETVGIAVVEDSRVALSGLAARFYGEPSRELHVIGITGTNGKTTTAHLIASMLEAAGARVGWLTTVERSVPDEAATTACRMTTPEAPEVHRLLRRMSDAGCQFAIVESTSHGLAQQRLDHVEYDVAVFTNLGADHLDFHSTFEGYRAAKGRLFSALDRVSGKRAPRWAIANADDPSAGFMLARTRAPALRFGLASRDADVIAREIRCRRDGSEFRLAGPTGEVHARTRLAGRFNVANALAGAAVGIALGMDLDTVAEGLRTCPGVPGRMERIAGDQPFDAIVDYAHTGDAVRRVLATLREGCRGRLVVVVGAAGARDRRRRLGIARAVRATDLAVFTSEDPRDEDPEAIVRELGRYAERAGLRRGRDFVEIEDRRSAITSALRGGRAGDVIVFCGKGHERSMLYGADARAWDEGGVVREELRLLGY